MNEPMPSVSGRWLDRRAASSGQTLIFVPVVLLMIAVFFCITYDLAWYCKKRIALQEAADSAAIGAARVQGMMLESIAAGNDAIAVNVAQILADIPKVVDDPVGAVKDIIERTGWIKSIQGVQGALSSKAGMFLVEAAAYANGREAGADLAFVLPPSNDNFMGIDLPDTTGSHPELLVQSPASWTLWLFTMREPKMIIPVPTSFPLEEKPVVVAISDESGEMPLGIPIWKGLAPPMFNSNKKFGMLVATSASAPYFIPLGGDPMDRAAMEDENSWRGVVCLMIPGPFWGARLDEVGLFTGQSLASGAAAWAGKSLLAYGIDKLIDLMKEEITKKAATTLAEDVADENEIELETFGEND